LICESFASLPELVKKTLEVGQGDLLDLLGELDRRLVAAPAEEVRKRELPHLLGRGLDKFGIAVPEARAP